MLPKKSSRGEQRPELLMFTRTTKGPRANTSGGVIYEETRSNTSLGVASPAQAAQVRCAEDQGGSTRRIKKTRPNEAVQCEWKKSSLVDL